jgi:hypothetical protein
MEWFPTRKCGTTDERATCTRGWATYSSERDCCEAGAAFTEGCGNADVAEAPAGEMSPSEEEFIDVGEKENEVYVPAVDALLAEQRAMSNPQEVQAFAAAAAP